MIDDIVLAKDSDGKYLWCKRSDAIWHNWKRNAEGKLKRCKAWRKFEFVNPQEAHLPNVNFSLPEYLTLDLEEILRNHFNVPDEVGRNNCIFDALLSRFERESHPELDIGWISLPEIKLLYELHKNNEFTKLLCLVENLCRQANSCCTGNEPLIDLNEIE